MLIDHHDSLPQLPDLPKDHICDALLAGHLCLLPVEDVMRLLDDQHMPESPSFLLSQPVVMDPEEERFDEERTLCSRERV